jgi:hypothetical protein
VFTKDILFLHMPKTAGSSVTDYLLRVLPQPVHYIYGSVLPHFAEPGIVHVPGSPHYPIEEAGNILRTFGINMEQMPLILAVLRNPYDLVVSLFCWFTRSDNLALDGSESRSPAIRSTFREWVVAAAKHPRDPLGQSWHYFHLRGTIPPNLRIVRFDSLRVDVNSALEEIGISISSDAVMRHNKRSTREAFPTYYDSLTEEIVFTKNRWMFERGFFDRLRIE